MANLLLRITYNNEIRVPTYLHNICYGNEVTSLSSGLDMSTHSRRGHRWYISFSFLFLWLTCSYVSHTIMKYDFQLTYIIYVYGNEVTLLSSGLDMSPYSRRGHRYYILVTKRCSCFQEELRPYQRVQQYNRVSSSCSTSCFFFKTLKRLP